MKRFDVCPVTGFGGSRKARLVVVLQHEALVGIDTTVVVPLFKPADVPPVHVLRPLVTVSRQKFVVSVERLASIPSRQLGKPVDNLERAREELLRATDLLFFGF